MRAAKAENITESGMQVIEFNRANVVGASSGPNQVLDFFIFNSLLGSPFRWNIIR